MAEPPTNAEVAAALREIADHLDFTGRSHYPVRAYRRAAASIERLPVSVTTLALEGRATDISGVGPSTAAKILELVETGSIQELERKRARTPADLMVLARMPKVGRRLAERIWEHLGPAGLAAVEAAARADRLTEVQGVGPRTVEAVLAGIARLREEPGAAAVPMLRTQAERAVRSLEDLLERLVPGVLRFHVGGELARGEELVDVVDLVVVAEDAGAATAVIRERLDSRGWYAAREEPLVEGECLTFALHGATGAGVRIHVTAPDHEPLAVLTAVGPEEHAAAVLRLLGDASQRSRVFAHAASRSEGSSPDAGLYAEAGLAHVPFELRHRPDALTLAASDAVPHLVREEDLRGELHCHSTWSDGRNPIEDMVNGATERGNDYICITDHSHSLRIVNGLDARRLAHQAEEMAALRAGLPSHFTLLQGIEMEILPDGSLDLDDDTLSRLDWVVASIHTKQRQSAAEITARMEQAMRSPWVDCIGHPTSRLLLKRPKTQLDTDRLIELAAETGTFLEMNASPDRLDLDAATAERAAAAGVRICIHSDAHGPETLGLVRHGVALARHAGLTATQVVNTHAWEEIRAMQKRNR